MNSDCTNDPVHPRRPETNEHHATLAIYKTLSEKKQPRAPEGSRCATPGPSPTLLQNVLLPLFCAECTQLLELFIGS